MVLHVTFLVESLPAFVTLERFLPSVGPLMKHQRRLLLERLSALLTDVRSFPGVDADVNGQVCPLDERLVTQRTLVRFVAQVNELVALQMGPEVERLVAGPALEWTLSLVVPDGDMFPQAGAPGKGLPAHFTGVDIRLLRRHLRSFLWPLGSAGGRTSTIASRAGWFGFLREIRHTFNPDACGSAFRKPSQHLRYSVLTVRGLPRHVLFENGLHFFEAFVDVLVINVSVGVIPRMIGILYGIWLRWRECVQTIRGGSFATCDGNKKYSELFIVTHIKQHLQSYFSLEQK